jgi:hypothetical protein
MELVLVAGLDAAVVVAVVVDVAGLEAVVGILGATVGLWAAAMDAVTARIVSVFIRYVGLMVAGIVLREIGARQASATIINRVFLRLQQS